MVQIPLGYHALSAGGKRTVINLKTIITSKAEFNTAVLTPVSPIGVFDSGIGGLNVLKRATAKLPHESFIYFGDNENAPYGNKSESELFELSKNAVNTLLSRGVKAIVVACNTVSSSVFNKLLSVSPVPLIPTLPPIVKNKAKRTLLMCTPNTAKSDYVLKNYDFAQVLPLPFLAAEIERYLYSKDNFTEKHAKSTKLNRLKNVNLDKDLRGAYGIYDIVVLGCTHYTFLKKEIAARFPSAKIISGEQKTAVDLKHTLINLSLLREHGSIGGVEFIGNSALKNKRMFNFVQN